MPDFGTEPEALIRKHLNTAHWGDDFQSISTALHERPTASIAKPIGTASTM